MQRKDKGMGMLSWFQSKPELERKGTNSADLVLVNGRVLTCDKGGRRVDSFAIRDGRFTYVGGAAGIADFVGPETEIIDVIDARDRVVTPASWTATVTSSGSVPWSRC